MFPAVSSFSLLCLASLLYSSHVKSENVTVDYFLTLINSRQTSWKAGKHFVGNFTVKTLTRSNVRIFLRRESYVPDKPCNLEDVQIPESFDARTHWPECSDVIGRVENQGQCEACWAFAATSVMSDRLCIKTNGRVKFQFSPQDLVSCCSYCDSGCTVGVSSKAWHYYANHGIVSGGGFNSFQGCKPYQESEFMQSKKTECNKRCDNPSYDVPYADDKHFGSEYYMVNKTPECIQKEILENGPVQVTMGLYEDFAFYKQGVYFYTVGKRRGLHSVKIVGWGVENGIRYWLAANSWGCQWGNLNGFFKITRGVDECAIEQHVIAGLPQVPKLPKLDGYVRTTVKSEFSTSKNVVWPVILGVSACLVIITLLSIVFHDRIKNLVPKYFRFS